MIDGETVLDRLLARADREPDRRAYVYLSESGAEAGALTFRNLAERAASAAAALARRRPKPPLAVLLFPTGPEFITAYFACLMAQVAAIPVPMPLPNRPPHGLEAIVEATGVGIALCAAASAETLERSLAPVPRLAGLDLKPIETLSGNGSLPGRPAADDIAFLQFTSGSTGRPKGVVITHGNLMANSAMSAEGMALTPDTDIVTWLPHFHDMGLIGMLLQSVYTGCTSTVISPASFAKRPVRWLAAISGRPLAVSGAPNFAYDLCVSRIPPGQEAGLDLSGWKVAFSGAEPVRARTIDRFVERFSAIGFRREAIYPCYGMSETTLIAAGAIAGKGPVTRDVDRAALERGTAKPPADPATAYRTVSSGRALTGQRFAIADPETGALLADDRVGEIWVAGPHVARGYWEQPEATAEAFGARLAGIPASPDFVRTGDLGFVADGELFVTGRRKEMLIVAGRNLYPHDLEEPARACHPDIRDIAVFAIDPDLAGERIVAVVEVEGESRHRLRAADSAADPPAPLAALARAVRGAIGTASDVAVAQVCLVLPGRILKTTSGKTRYAAIRQRFLDLPETLRGGELILQNEPEPPTAHS
jgi:acyl-CoA synthetase (AMP-forming)/AMP-acid ligase II